jgi:hypothetical protein
MHHRPLFGFEPSMTGNFFNGKQCFQLTFSFELLGNAISSWHWMVLLCHSYCHEM